tara:strand:+ start:3486 stop:3686 length:201 start_codon:yes stop_codon:yes gene_type:complete
MAGGNMQVGDLVRHIQLRKSRQVGIITEIKIKGGKFVFTKRYKVLWAGIHTEEYWFTNKEVEAICK